jgi:hypothetical protein
MPSFSLTLDIFSGSLRAGHRKALLHPGTWGETPAPGDYGLIAQMAKRIQYLLRDTHDKL